MKKYKSLSSKITIFSTLVILIAAALIAIVVYSTTRMFFYAASVENLKNQTTLISNDIQNSLMKVENDIVLLSKTPPIQGIIRSTENNGTDPLESSTTEKWQDRLAVIFAAMLKVNKSYTQIRYIGMQENGKEIVRVDQYRNDTYRVHGSALQSKGDTFYFKKTIGLTQGSVAFSQINYNTEKNKVAYPLIPTLRVMMPIYSNKQKIFGILVINVNIKEYLQSILIDMSESHDIIIYDKYKSLFIYNEKEHALDFHTPEDKFKFSREGSEKTVDSNQLINDILKDTNNLAIIKPIYSNANKNSKIFTLINSIPRNLVLQRDQTLINYILLWIVSISIIASVVIYLFSRKLMQNLSRMANTISQSSSDEKLELPSYLNDEVGLLAQAFEKKTKQLHELALFDSLTGLPNRTKFTEHLEKAIIRAHRNKYPVAVIFIDLDKFKSVNDRFGHDYGNELLIKFSARLKKVTRETDLCSRLSGDEFAVVVENVADASALKDLINRYLDDLSQPYDIKGMTIHQRFSIGISLYPDNASSAEELLNQADEMMYKSKEEGEGKVYFYQTAT